MHFYSEILGRVHRGDAGVIRRNQWNCTKMPCVDSTILIVILIFLSRDNSFSSCETTY